MHTRKEIQFFCSDGLGWHEKCGVWVCAGGNDCQLPGNDFEHSHLHAQRAIKLQQQEQRERENKRTQQMSII